jgi:hypothetical protein
MLGGQHAAFRVHSATGFTMIQLEGTSDNLTFTGVLQPASFPRPIVVTDDLGSDPTAFQMISLHPFRVSAGCIACFAFDEPFAYPAMISLVDGTGFVIFSAAVEAAAAPSSAPQSPSPKLGSAASFSALGPLRLRDQQCDGYLRAGHYPRRLH